MDCCYIYLPILAWFVRIIIIVYNPTTLNNDMTTTTTHNEAAFRGLIPGMAEDDSVIDKDNMISYGKQTKNVYHLWLVGEVGEATSYMKWFDILQNASDDDLVVIHINSVGGEMMTAVQLITQIKLCSAQVVCQIESMCCSAATMIALACDGLVCYPHAYMMIHTSSGCMFGKQSDIKKEEEFFNPWLENFFNEIYKHFLTKKEIQSVLEGKDMWIGAEEVMERFKRRVDIINKENARAKREHMKKLNTFMNKLQTPEGAAEILEEEGITDSPAPKKQQDDKKKDRKPRKQKSTKG